MNTKIRPKKSPKNPDSGSPRRSRADELAAIERFVAKNHVQTVPATPVDETETLDPFYRPKWRVHSTFMPPEWIS